MKKLMSLFFILMTINVYNHSQIQPGAIFREYKWRPERNGQRVTGENPETDRAKKHLPNKINTILIDDLEQAQKVEVTIEMLLCHSGTIGKKIRVNNKSWIDIPEPDKFPADKGVGGESYEYQHMWYPTIEIPKDMISSGENTFEFACTNGIGLGKWWPQWIFYGVIFRVYYTNDKPSPSGKIVSPLTNDTLKHTQLFHIEANSPNGVSRVDIIGNYKDFDWDGDGIFHEWQYNTRYCEIQHHVGSSFTPPYYMEWDNSWIPDQDDPMKFVAKITDKNGLSYISEPISGIHMHRPLNVKMLVPYNIPKNWSTRIKQTDSCNVDVPEHLDGIKSAKIVMTTWNGCIADEVGINNTSVISHNGLDHDLSYEEFNLPIQLIKHGKNQLYTYSETEHHGLEVQWPGMVLFIKYVNKDFKAH